MRFAGGHAAQFSDIDRITDDIFHSAVFKLIAPMGTDADFIEIAGNSVIALASDKAAENFADDWRLVLLGEQFIICYARCV